MQRLWCSPRIEHQAQVSTLAFALRYPILPVTRELREDCPELEKQLRWFRRGYDDFNTDVRVYGVIGLHWLLRAYAVWRAHRWCIERWLKREGVLMAPYNGCYFHELHGHQRFT